MSKHHNFRACCGASVMAEHKGGCQGLVGKYNTCCGVPNGAIHEDDCPAKLEREYEAVNHPPHYNQHPAGIECIDVIEHFNLNIGNAMKYLWRAGLKPGQSAIQDLAKAEWYVQREQRRILSGPLEYDGTSQEPK